MPRIRRRRRFPHTLGKTSFCTHTRARGRAGIHKGTITIGGLKGGAELLAEKLACVCESQMRLYHSSVAEIALPVWLNSHRDQP